MVSHTPEGDFRPETRADSLTFDLSVSPERLNELELAERVARLPNDEKAAAVIRRCAADLVTTAIFMAPNNRALAETAK